MATLQTTQQTFTINGRTFTLGEVRQARLLGIDIHKDDFEMKELNPNYRKARDEAEKAEKKKPATKKVKPKTEEAVKKEASTVVEPIENVLLNIEAVEKIVAEVKAKEEEVEVAQATPEEVAEFEALTAERAWLMNEKKARYQELKKKLNK